MLRFRALEPEDMELLFEAENDTAAWADGDTLAPYSRHALSRYILNYDSDPFAAGQLRLVAVEDGELGESMIGLLDFYELSALHRRGFVGIYIRRKFRSQGYGERILRLAEGYGRRVLLLDTLGAKVLAGNGVSRRLFARAGYRLAGTLKCWHRGEDMEILQILL